jgi:hypothetical protein
VQQRVWDGLTHMIVIVLLIHILEHGYIHLIVTADWPDTYGRQSDKILREAILRTNFEEQF